MDRKAFRKCFKTTGVVILPVIHVIDEEQIVRNAEVAIRLGAPGVFLINHDFGMDPFLPLIRSARRTFPSLWIGVNFLGVDGGRAFPVLARLGAEGYTVDGYWADDARIDESTTAEIQAEGDAILEQKTECGWSGLYFGGTAFKKQRPVDPQHYQTAASYAADYMDVVTTSGEATGRSAEGSKVAAFRVGVGEKALALASGVTAENLAQYATDIDAALVATGINYHDDFYNIDPCRLEAVLRTARASSLTGSAVATCPDPGPRDQRRYLALMAPRSRSPEYAWLDPSSAYVNARSFNAMLDDLLRPFMAEGIDVVAGFDAAGFVLGAAMAARLGTGFLTIRKGGKMAVEYDAVPMINYSGKTQSMEMRKPAFAPGTRVLLVDQWVETGGTMSAGIELVQRQDGIVAGIAAICIEDNEATQRLRKTYKTASCVIPGSELQRQCDRQTLESFAEFRPEHIFPDISASKR